MAMGTYPIPFHAHGKENFGRTTPSSPPRSPRPGPAWSLTGSTRPPSTDGPKMAAARPTPPARPPSCPRLGPARWARLPRAGPAARAASHRFPAGPGRARRSPHHGGGAAPAAARPRRAPTGKGRTPHLLVTTSMSLRSLTSASAAPVCQPHTPSPSSGPSSSPGPSPCPSLFGPVMPILSSPCAFVPLGSQPKQGTLFRRRDPAWRVTLPSRASRSAGGRELRSWRAAMAAEWRRRAGGGLGGLLLR